jgi:hypothetical protein
MYHRYNCIVMCMSDYRQGCDWWSDLLNRCLPWIPVWTLAMITAVFLNFSQPHQVNTRIVISNRPLAFPTCHSLIIRQFNIPYYEAIERIVELQTKNR